MRHLRQRIHTKDKAGNHNGLVIPVWSLLDGIVPPEMYARQVYVTTVTPGAIKGPHLHMKRWGMFCCIKGNVKIITKTKEGVYGIWHSGDHYDHALIQIPPGVGAAIQSICTEESYVLNLPSEPYDPADPDEHAIEFDEKVFHG